MQNITAPVSFLSCPPSFLDVNSTFNEISIVVGLLAIPVGLILAVCGCRLCRVTFFLCGLISGVLVTYAIIRDQIDTMQLPFEGALGIAFGGGLILGLLSLGVQVLGLFVVGMSASFLFAATGIGIVAHFLTFDERWQTAGIGAPTLLFSSPFPSRWLPIGCLLASCLLGGLVSLLRPRHLLIIGSSLIGAAILILTFGYFLETRNPLRPVRFIFAAIIGTRYMQTHYGKYLFGYIPSPSSLRNSFNVTTSGTSFSVSSLFPQKYDTNYGSTTTVSQMPSEVVQLTFLCWSDFVLLVCWLLIASFCALFQFMCLRSSKRRAFCNGVKRKSRRRRLSVSKTHTSGVVKTESRHISDLRQASGNICNEFPEYSVIASHTVNEITENGERRASSIGTNVFRSAGTEQAGVNWMSIISTPTRADAVFIPTTTSSVIAASSSKAVQNSPHVPGHLLRMRRSLGDVLSRDFIRNCVSPKALPSGSNNQTIPQC